MKQLMISLFFFSVFGATTAWAAEKESPLSVTGATTVNVNEAKAMFDKGVAFIDVRNSKDWGAGRIPGAIHLDVKSAFNEKALQKVVKKDEEVVMYCNGPSCLRSSEASVMAVQWGFKKVRYFRDGFPAWKAAGLPVE